MNTHVFTYGSLMFAEVWQQVVRGRYATVAAMLDGYQRFAVREAAYPGILASDGARVDGLVYADVDADDLARLDAFEGDLYQRIDAVVADAQGGSVQVQTYLCVQPDCLSDQPWLPEAFALQEFLASYCRDKLGS